MTGSFLWRFGCLLSLVPIFSVRTETVSKNEPRTETICGRASAFRYALYACLCGAIL